MRLLLPENLRRSKLSFCEKAGTLMRCLAPWRTCWHPGERHDRAYYSGNECQRRAPDPRWASALSKSDPGLLSKSDPPKRGGNLPLARGKGSRQRGQGTPGWHHVCWIQGTCAPSARMKSLCSFSCPWARLVLCVGHSIRAQVGHSSGAPTAVRESVRNSSPAEVISARTITETGTSSQTLTSI